ncbi:DUF192 domain-containing protein [Amylibacter sp. SFDW26]|uniref:DUF192 domain-containing protein n=1 Tax=Amylibacter sp. SFDW26 TaxID=2652722 RepID=UPI001D00C1AC|nr:DUF192 domain-containing protein [Amylibacter sp. SFDW26]
MLRKSKYIVSVAFILALPTQGFANCAVDRVLVQSGKNSASFAIEVADTEAERNKGLMFRETMPKFSGMLFVYEAPQTASFWMRNTLIPLDMLFINEVGVVTKVHSNAVPLDETPIFGGNDVFAVLELNGGLAQNLGLKEGALLQHPAFDPAIAALPCKK